MSVQLGATVVLEVSSRNASWVTIGIFGGLIYGFMTTSGDGENAGGRIFSCALIGGAVMGIIGNILLWANIVETPSCLLSQKQGGKTLRMGGEGNSKSKMLKNYTTELKIEVIDGLLTGAIIGTLITLINFSIHFLFGRRRGPRFPERIFRGALQGGMMGCLLRTVLTFFKLYIQ
ncbi:hypothetical protein Phum_PHUM259830 [Pediculus humanus corporis]|uniref:Transmembrane protein n=1 Tax=Pediculus humanus subsp. corporis TaxID=121224 RepID=E0VKC0_PEDHC|nr:uncharacterized protein Phum_PHUM259830 [Pediculus humanus corporis]EEB13826.1 hypothetical protein Phum_PHUM259830 [Pediculus humanus corporis]